LLASALAWRLVEPAQLVREVEESAKSRRALSLEDAEADPWNELTEREQQVADLAGQGLKTKAIATQLFMSPDNVKKRLQSVYRKMGCDRRGLIVRYLARPRATSPP
jgi:DNA-binding NarL/FixJ family response regulator